MDEKFIIQKLYDAYRKMKNYFYYDNSSMYTRLQIAKFEEDLYKLSKDKFVEAFSGKIDPLVKLMTSNNYQASDFERYLKDIQYRLLPKSMEKDDDSRDETKTICLSNQAKTGDLKIEKYNILIDAPVEIHLISTLWLMIVGAQLSSLVGKHNYAYQMRVIKAIDDEGEIIPEGLQLYEPYYIGYQNWRDDAIKEAETLLDKGKDATIISLDITRYFYNLRIDLPKFVDKLLKIRRGNISREELEEIELIPRLTTLLYEIHKRFWEKARPFFDEIALQDSSLPPLPVGLISSGLIGNLYLRNFDSKVITNLHPDYYGRYVDDMLFVIGEADIKADAKTFLKTIFVNSGLLNSKDDNGTILYQINLSDDGSSDKEVGQWDDNNFLIIQQGKIVMEKFDHRASRAALKKFKRNIQKKRSEFRLLPDEVTVENDFDDAAFTMQYNGSVNKFRSIKEFTEDKYGASTYLAHQIALASYSVEENSRDIKQISQQILTFFRGEVAVDFYSLWEKVCTYFIIRKDVSSLTAFQRQILTAIQHCTFNSTNGAIEAIKEALKEWLKIAIATPLSMNLDLGLPEDRFEQSIYDSAKEVRHSNMFRDNYLGIAGMNLTSAVGEGCNLYAKELPNLDRWRRLGAEEGVILLFPHHIHFESINIILNFIKAKTDRPRGKFINERLVSVITESKNFYDKANFSWWKLFIGGQPRHFQLPIDVHTIKANTSSSHKICGITVRDQGVKDKCNSDKKVAIANLCVEEDQIKKTAIGKINLSKQRQKDLFKIINEAIREKCNMLVLPELAVPYQWLGLLARESRDHNLAIITGISYIIDASNQALNLVVTILPFRTKYTKSCVIIPRVKNHYAPKEEIFLKGYHFNIPQCKNSAYHLFHWQKCYFSVYNCFELASIEDRSLLKSKVDLIIATEYNSDTNYYSDVAGSWVRDIHAFFIQVNTAIYGDSRIMKPAKTEEKNLVIVKGGKNATAQVDDLQIDKLRKFQYPDYTVQLQDKNKPFKMTPPDFDKGDVMKRINDEDF